MEGSGGDKVLRCFNDETFMINVEKYLKENKIEYKVYLHPAVYTCEDTEKYDINIPGLACKNLFLKDKKADKYFLVVLPATKRMDLKKFESIITSKVSFGSSEALKEKLGIEPGSVSIFGLSKEMFHNFLELLKCKVEVLKF